MEKHVFSKVFSAFTEDVRFMRILGADLLLIAALSLSLSLCPYLTDGISSGFNQNSNIWRHFGNNPQYQIL
jgi:hypothetical protein